MQKEMHIDHILPDKCVFANCGFITHNLSCQALLPTSDNLLNDMFPPAATNKNNSNLKALPCIFNFKQTPNWNAVV